MTKSLESCKEYFKSVYTNWLVWQDEESETRLKALEETLKFIYDDFKNVHPRWIQEASKEYYKG